MKLKKMLIALHAYLLTKYLYRLSRRNSTQFFKWQQKKLKTQLQKIEAQSPYYHQFSHLPLAEKPILNKQVMLTHFNTINTAGLTLDEVKEVAIKSELSRDFSPKIGNVSVGLSSGTSGNHGVFLVNDSEAARWAGSIIAKLISFRKYRKEKIKIAFFMRANNNLYETINSKKFELHFFDLQVPFENHFSRLEQLKPNVLIAQPSALRLIADHYQTAVPFTLKDVFSVAEVLDPIDKRYIEAALDLPIRQIYQATEGLLGYTCEYGGLHINEDIIYMEKEYIDDRRFVPIVTDLYRITQPYVRYRLNDILVEAKEKCRCGSCFTHVEMIEGREDDCFLLKRDNGEAVRLFPDFIRYAITRTSDAITSYKAVQKQNKITLFLEGDFKNWETLCSDIKKNIDGYFSKQGITQTAYDLEFRYGVPITENKKMRRIERVE